MSIEGGSHNEGQSHDSRRVFVLRDHDVADIQVEAGMVAQIESLLTPQEILNRRDFPKPEVIIPPTYPNYDALLAARGTIRTLGLLPVKSDFEYHRYHAQPRDYLTRLVQEHLTDTNFALAENEFPYFLPRNVRQHIAWIKNPGTTHPEIAEFIARCLTRLNATPDETILFERSLNTSATLVRGTIPEFRHVHVWTRDPEIT